MTDILAKVNEIMDLGEIRFILIINNVKEVIESFTGFSKIGFFQTDELIKWRDLIKINLRENLYKIQENLALSSIICLQFRIIVELHSVHL